MANIPAISKADWRKRLSGLSASVSRMLEEAAGAIDRRQLDSARRDLVATLKKSPVRDVLILEVERV